MLATTTRRRLLTWLGAAAAAGGAGCAATAGLPAGSAALLAPSGRLRASINLGNPILARHDAASGEVVGVSVDLARELARQLGVPVDLQVFDAAAKSVAAVTSAAADIGFFAIDPLRGQGIRFTAAYVLIEGAYLVRQDSPLRDNGEVDRPGLRIMAAKGSAYDLHLGRTLKAATLAHSTTSQNVVDTFLSQGVEVAAGVKQQLQADAERLPGLRLLPGRFMVIEQAMGLPADRGELAQAALKGYVEQAKASGFVAQALQRHQIQGALVAPPAAA